MSTTDHGTQDATYNYYEEATARNFNKRMLAKLNPGIYSGGYLTRVSDIEVTMAVADIEIGDGTYQVSIKTSAAATINNSTLDGGTILSSTPVIVLRWTSALTAVNYFEIHALANVAAAQANDVIVGKINFTGSTIVDFDYTDRTRIDTLSSFLKVEVTPETELRVQLRAGRIQNSIASVFVPDQKVGLFTNPASPNSRIDLVYIDSDGTPTILQGTQAVSPSAPSYGNRLVVAEVTIAHDASNIVAVNISDARIFSVPIPTPMVPTTYTGQESTTFPNGRIEKEGITVITGIAQSVVFTNPFPTECRYITFGIEDADDRTFNPHFYSRSTTGFSFKVPSVTGANFHWRAVGR